MNILHHQYAAPLHTNPIILQKQLSKMKEDTKHLQQTKRPNVYPIPPGNYRSFRTADGLVICRRCNCVGHFVRACPANLSPPRAPTRYQNYQRTYIPPVTSQYPQPLYTPNQHSQRASYRSNDSRYDTMGYPYPQDAIYTNPSQRPPSPSVDWTGSKYQARSSTSQVNNTIIVTRSETMLYRTDSASYQAA